MLAAMPSQRNPAALLEKTRRHWGGQNDLWIFGYASLIWRPEFDFSEHRPAKVHGWHRAFQMHSRINRGTPERPGLVYALVSGGACRGMVYRIPLATAHSELDKLWLREMPTGVYDPRWLQCLTAQGPVTALAFTLSRHSQSFTGRMDDAQLAEVLRHARGRYGSTLDYLVKTASTLTHLGMCDKETKRVLKLAKQLGS
jgi:cation transport protein ChaC